MATLDQHLSLLTRLVEAADMRQKVISQNIANVNTPNYERMEVAFEEHLARELSRRTPAVGSQLQPAIRKTPGLTTRADGNNVDIDMELGQLNKNAMLQQVYLQLLGAEVSQMQRAMEIN